MPSREPAYFEQLYNKNRDPWNFVCSIYEKEKYHNSIATLGNKRFQSGFEIGCSIGVLTKMIAERCDCLLAVDVVETALTDAADRCKHAKHVSFENRQMPQDWPCKVKFDLIVCSEILYFLSPEDISTLADRMSRSLIPGGNILLVNYTGKIQEPCNGDDAASIMITQTSSFCSLSTHLKSDGYRIDLLSRFLS